MSWLDDLLGIRSIRDLAGTVLPQRGGLRVAGGIEATDDPSTGETVLTVSSSLGAGDVVGPGVATDNAVARFDSTTGKLVKNSAVTIDNSGNIATAGTVDGRDVSTDGATLTSHVANTSNPHSVTIGQVSSKLATVDALTWAADRIAYFTGTATSAIATLTSFGRTLIATEDAAGARTELGVESSVTVRVAYATGQHNAAYTLDGTHDGKNIVIMAPVDQALVVTPDGGSGVEVNGSNSTFEIGPGQIAYLTPTGVSNRWYTSITGGVQSFSVGITPDVATTDLTTGDDKILFKAPYDMRIQSFLLECHPDHVSSSGHVAVMVRRGGGDLLTNPVRVDEGEDSSLTASVAYSWAGDYYACSQGDQFRFDCDAAGTGVRGVLLHIIAYPVSS